MTEAQAERPTAKASGPIQFTTLNKWRRERAMLEVYLVNGQRLVGRVRSFDRFSMLLEMPQGGCFVFHHTVSTLQPAAKGARRPAPAGRPGARHQDEGDGGAPTRRPSRPNDDEPMPRSRPAAAPEVKVVRRTRRTIQRDS